MKLTLRTLGGVLIAFGIVLLIVLTLVKLNLDEQGAFLCKLVDESEELTMDQCPAHDDPNSWLILAGFGVSFLIIGAGVYLVLMPLKKVVEQQQSQERRKVNVSTFDGEEKKIYDLLLLNEGSMYQSDIIKETGLTKVRVSRILDKLEGKRIIERKRRGMTNIVVLK